MYGLSIQIKIGILGLLGNDVVTKMHQVY